MIVLTNISGGQIVCDLASGKTLRLNNKQSQTVKDEDVTAYIRRLEQRGLILCRKKEKTSSKVK